MTATVASPPAGLRKGQGRQRLLTAAAQLFGAQGYDAISTKELATTAGVTIGALYHHFPSKEAIYKAAVQDALDALPAAPLAEAARGEPAAGVELLVAWFSETLLNEPLVRQELLAPHLDVPLSDLSFFTDALALFRQLVPHGAPGIDPNLAIGAIVSLAFGMTSLKGLSGLYHAPETPREMAHVIVRLVLNGGADAALARPA